MRQQRGKLARLQRLAQRLPLPACSLCSDKTIRIWRQGEPELPAVCPECGQRTHAQVVKVLVGVSMDDL
jgi:hypothetical protein